MVKILGSRHNYEYRLVLEDSQWRLLERLLVGADGELTPVSL